METRNLKLHVLATGSKGNCSVVENAATGHSVLIDCGICKRDFLARCSQAGVDPNGIEAVLISHAHSDHTKGLEVVLRGLAKLGVQPVICADPATVRESSPLSKVQAAGQRFQELQPSVVAGMRVIPFPTSHDTRASYGFRFECEDEALGFMTDTGVVTKPARQALQGCRTLAIEANHDVKMLKDGPYPYPLKMRILGEGGHLSNDQCAQLLAELCWDGLEDVIAMHASETNNTYDLALAAVSGTNATPHTGYQNRLVSI